MNVYKFHCGGAANWSGPCGASDCGTCRNGPAPWEDDDTETCELATTRTLHIASKPYRSTKHGGRVIKAGDLYERETGFEYLIGGERTGYLSAGRKLIARAPANGGPADAWEYFMLRRSAQLSRRRCGMRYGLTGS